MDNRLTLLQAQSLLSRHLPAETILSSIERVDQQDFLRDHSTEVYILHLSAPSSIIYILKLSIAPVVPRPSYLPNTLATEHAFLTRLAAVASSLPLPTPTPVHFSPTPSTLLPHPYLLLSRPSGCPLATFGANERVDTHTGAFLRALHAIDNDWFGRPDAPPAEQVYSWQDAFVLMLEEALEDLADAPGVPVERIRMLLGRAIGSFLFEDVEVPALVAFTGSAPASFLVAPTANAAAPEDDGARAGGAGEVVCALANGLPRAVWGDPLLERAFVGAREALVRAYTGVDGDGGPGLTPFARQRTKMVWYELYAALVVLAEGRRAHEEAGVVEGERHEETEKWAREEVGRCVERLKDAPCY